MAADHLTELRDSLRKLGVNDLFAYIRRPDSQTMPQEVRIDVLILVAGLDEVLRVKPPQIRKVEVTATPSLNIRERPVITSTRVGSLPTGTIVEVIGDPVNGFLKLNDGRGWISQQFVRNVG